MAKVISGKTLYLDAARENVVEEGDERAAFLLVRKGSSLDASEAEKWGVTGEEAPEWDARAEHERLHAGETQQEADQKHAAMLEGNVDTDAKAQTKAPSNKAVSGPAEIKEEFSDTEVGPVTKVEEDAPASTSTSKKGK